MAQLQSNYTALLSQKQADYADYKLLKKELLEFETAKQNINRIFQMQNPVDVLLGSFGITLKCRNKLPPFKTKKQAVCNTANRRFSQLKLFKFCEKSAHALPNPLHRKGQWHPHHPQNV